MLTALLVYGTRPEAIKMAPLVHELTRSDHIRPAVAVTGQHRQMLDQVNRLFGISPSYDLDIIKPRQSLEDITAGTLRGLAPIIDEVAPDFVVVQGDTTTSFAAALSAFYHRIPVVHVEAGLRTDDISNPYPEEVNRRLISRVATLHLAPTATSRDNLLREAVPPSEIVVTGNTVIDALHHVVRMRRDGPDPLEARLEGRRVVLVTAHRRESWGAPMARAASAIAQLAADFRNIVFVLPAHLNPTVRDVLLPALQDHPNVVITDPMDYGEFARLMARSDIVLTDSGGVQEEAPSLGKPVLVMRETTERPEAVEAGTVRLVGTDTDLIIKQVSTLLTDRVAYDSMAQAVNPYGDGLAARRSVQAIEHIFGLADRPSEFGS